MFSVSTPYPIFIGLDGNPLQNGRLYIGTENQNPETNPIAVYWDEAGTIPAYQPMVIGNGIPVRNGAPSQVFVSTNYAFTVRDSLGQLVFSSLAANNPDENLRADLATSAGASMIGAISPLAGAVARTQQGKNNDWVTIDDFDGADDAEKLNTALVSAATTIFVTRDLSIDSTVSMKAGKTLVLAGVSITSPAGLTTFEALEQDNWSIIGPFSINGTPGLTTAIGIAVEGCRNWLVSDYTASRIGGRGFRLKPGVDPVDFYNMGQMRGYRARSCYIGWEDVPGKGAEYCRVSDFDVSDCTAVGVITAAGNIIWHGGNINANTDGLYVNSGTNHAHGVMSAVNINHNQSNNIICTGVTNGYTFNACHIYANDLVGNGNIYLNGCNGVTFDGGTLDCQVYNDSGAGSGLNFIRNMYCPGDYGDVQILSNNGAAGSLIIQGCHGAGAFTSGVTINDPSEVYALARRAAGSAMTVTTNTVLLFPIAERDRRGIFSTGGGGFTIPAGGSGLYQITGHLYFVGTTVDLTASFVQLRKNAATYDLFCPKGSGTNIMTIEINSELFLSAGDIIDLIATAGGASVNVQLGGGTWGSQVSLRRIA